MTVERKLIACWIPKAVITRSGCVILTFFSFQQWLHERASMIYYTYIACLLFSSVRNYSCDLSDIVRSYLF
jgi:hypothetical protein